MIPMTANELRKKFIDFFVERGHVQISGASVIPENDPTVLFTTAGMHPLVPYLLGQEHPSGKRLTDYQKCIRTGDIDSVGDPHHLTCFEMLGNWSLGDYFKKEMIPWSFEFLTKVLEIPVRSFPSQYSQAKTAFHATQRAQSFGTAWEFHTTESSSCPVRTTGGGQPVRPDPAGLTAKCS